MEARGDRESANRKGAANAVFAVEFRERAAKDGRDAADLTEQTVD